MNSQPQGPQGNARPLAVHVSELSNATLGELHRLGYSIMDNTTGWVLFLQGAPPMQDANPVDDDDLDLHS